MRDGSDFKNQMCAGGLASADRPRGGVAVQDLERRGGQGALLIERLNGVLGDVPVSTVHRRVRQRGQRDIG